MKLISIDELKQLNISEGLILKGCGGDLQEWVDGINNLLTEQGILLHGDKFKNIVAFEHNGLTNLLFPMDNVKLDAGKLAMWRLSSHEQFGGTWLSDYLEKQLRIEPKQQGIKKPECPMIGADGNIFCLMGLASGTLKDAGMQEAATEMMARIKECDSYEAALAVIIEYVEPVSNQQENEFEMEIEY